MNLTFRVMLAVVVCSAGLFGQALSGTVVGTVTDSAGAVVPSAKVTLTNEGTRFTRTVESNQSGQYVAYSFPTGKITLTVEQPGFSKLIRSGVELTAADTLAVDLQLHVGSIQETVEVNAQATLLQTEDATVSSLMSNQQILEMPLNGRTFTQLIAIMPGTTATSPPMTAGTGGYGMRANTGVSINGSQTGNNSYLVDGMYDKGLWLNNLVIVPTIDSIQDARVQTSNYSAQYGASAGGVTVVQTKSGTNQYHGDVYEFLRNTDLNANTFFNNASGIPRTATRRNEFGGTVGGPIRKDKTFFFADYQGIRLTQPTSSLSTIPSLAQVDMVKTGNFSGLGTQIYNPYTTVTNSDGTQARVPIPNNQIPAGMLDPAAAKLIGFLPAPTSATRTSNYAFASALSQRIDQFDVRGDQNFGSADRLFLKYSYDNSRALSPGSIPAPAGAAMGPFLTGGATTSFKNWAAAANFTKVIGAHIVNETRIGAVRWNFGNIPTDTPFAPAAALGIPGINVSDNAGGLPGYTISGGGFATIGDSSTYPEYSRTITYQYEDVLTAVKGSHTLKFGGRYLRNDFNGYSAFPTRGTYDFNGQFTRQIGSTTATTALADFALGASDSINRASLSGVFGIRFYEFAAFAEDSWRVNNKLTVNVGLRYEIQAPPYEVHNRWANFDTVAGKLLLAGQNSNSRTVRNLDGNNFGPRAGIAYQIDPKTTLRSGFGVSYTEEFDGGTELYKNLPFLVSNRYTYDVNGAPGLLISQGLPAPTAPALSDPAINGGNPVAYPLNFQTPKILQGSFGIQREILPGVMLETSFVATRGLELKAKLNTNQPYPGPGARGPRSPLYSVDPYVGDLIDHMNWGGSKYRSLQVRLQTRAHHGLTTGVSYTWSHNMTNSGENQGANSAQNARNLSAEWGNSSYDRRQVLVINHVYELPFGKGKALVSQGWLSRVVGNWNVNGVWGVMSGLWFTPRDAGNVSNAQDTCNGCPNERPNRLGNGNLPSGQQTIYHWFDTSAFAIQPQFTFGNAANSILLGPGYFNLDAGIHRNFDISERLKAVFRWEIFNAFNHSNFSNPNASIGAPTAGVISSTLPARSQQVALKLIF